MEIPFLSRGLHDDRADVAAAIARGVERGCFVGPEVEAFESGFAAAGAIVTDNAPLAERLKRLRNGGQSQRYRHGESGVNSGLDEMQAAILRAGLPRLPGWTARRRALASGAFADLPPAYCRKAHAVSDAVLSLPLHPGRVDDRVDHVAPATNPFTESSVGASGAR
jgi:dTDP-4-amino-4,6-dideoxygalactose transaminase